MDTEGEKKVERVLRKKVKVERVRFRSGRCSTSCTLTRIYIKKKCFRKRCYVVIFYSFTRVCTRMCTINKKLQIIRDYEPTALDADVSKALVKLEEDNEDLSSDLKHLYFNYADEFPLPAVDRKALVILYPHRHRDRFHKIQVKLVTELEKEFSGYAVFLFARLTYVSRNLEDIERVFLEDVVYPAKILGKYVAGEDVKYYLDPKNDTKHKWEEFKALFKKYTEKQLSLEYIKELQASEA